MYNLVYSNRRITFDNVNVGYEYPYVSITYSTVEHGTVSGVATAQIGSTVTVTATPSSGYTLSYITVNGAQIVGNSFVVTGNTVVGAVFAEATYCQGDATKSAYPEYALQEPTTWSEISSLPSSIRIDNGSYIGYKTSLANDTSNLSSIYLGNGSGLWIGDNCYNGSTAPGLTFYQDSTILHIGNNSFNGSSTRTSASVNPGANTWEFGTNSCTNWDLTFTGDVKLKVNTGSLRTITLANSNARVIFSGRPGLADGSIVPIILDNSVSRFTFDGLTYSMLLRWPTTDLLRLIRYTGTNAREIWCYNMSSSDISMLNSKKPNIIDGDYTLITFVKKD